MEWRTYPERSSSRVTQKAWANIDLGSCMTILYECKRHLQQTYSCEHTWLRRSYLACYWYMQHQAIDSLGDFRTYSMYKSSQKHINFMYECNSTNSNYSSIPRSSNSPKHKHRKPTSPECPSEQKQTIPSQDREIHVKERSRRQGTAIRGERRLWKKKRVSEHQKQ